MLGLLRALTKSNRSIQMVIQNQGLTLPLSRQLSTQMENNSSDSFLQNPSTGLVYGRISGIGRHTRKSDISSMLGISKLSPDDVRFEYNANYAPVAVMIQFPSRNAYEATLRAVVRKSGLFRMEMADRQKWDTLPRYDGKTILLLGIPRNALADDVERFLVGCQYDASSIQMYARQPRGFDRSPARAVLVEFPSQALATHAFITKNRGFCLNSQIAVRLLP
ncbi:putative pathogenesis-related protein 1A-like [Capsicum annuum]|nr:putative pathogenesis-related protein 1A-like [Capsicum annuum]